MMHEHFRVLIPEARDLLVKVGRKLIRLAEMPPQTPGNGDYARALREAFRKLEGPYGDVLLTSQELHALRIAVAAAKGYGPVIPRALDRFMEELSVRNPDTSGRSDIRQAV